MFANSSGFADLQIRSIDYRVSGLVPRTFFFVDDNFFFNPKFGLTYNLSPFQILYLSYAKAQREPNRTDYENGNPKPKLNDFEFGWRVKFKN